MIFTIVFTCLITLMFSNIVEGGDSRLIAKLTGELLGEVGKDVVQAISGVSKECSMMVYEYFDRLSVCQRNARPDDKAKVSAKQVKDLCYCARAYVNGITQNYVQSACGFSNAKIAGWKAAAAKVDCNKA